MGLVDQKEIIDVHDTGGERIRPRMAEKRKRPGSVQNGATVRRRSQ